MQAVLLIALAGAAGAVARYGVGVLTVRSLGDHFAFGTLAVNILGCLALGFLLEMERSTSFINPSWRLLLSVGFLGAFTTFSAFGYETLRYLQAGTPHLAAVNVVANLVLGLAAVWLGLAGARLLMPTV